MSFTALDCPHCHASRAPARIVTGAQLGEAEGEARYVFTALCQDCGMPVTLIARRTPSRVADGDPLVRHVCKTGHDPVPSYVEIIEMIPPPRATTGPEDLPGPVAAAYAEARDCLKRGAAISGAMSLRLAIERAVRTLDPKARGSLAERIGRLAAERGMPRELVRWAGEIAVVRDEPADMAEDPADGDLRGAADFAETFFICAFTLPARIARQRAGAEKQAPQPERPEPPAEPAGKRSEFGRRGIPAGSGAGL